MEEFLFKNPLTKPRTFLRILPPELDFSNTSRGYCLKDIPYVLKDSGSTILNLKEFFSKVF